MKPSSHRQGMPLITNHPQWHEHNIHPTDTFYYPVQHKFFYSASARRVLEGLMPRGKIKRTCERDFQCTPQCACKAMNLFCQSVQGGFCACGCFTERCQCGFGRQTLPFHLERAPNDREFRFVVDRDVEPGQFIIPVVGVMKTIDELDEEEEIHHRHRYFGKVFKQIFCDATFVGNSSRAIRYRCENNAEIRELWKDETLYYAVFSTSHIMKGEEVFLLWPFTSDPKNCMAVCSCARAFCKLKKDPAKQAQLFPEGHPSYTALTMPVIEAVQSFMDCFKNENRTKRRAHPQPVRAPITTTTTTQREEMNGSSTRKRKLSSQEAIGSQVQLKRIKMEAQEEEEEEEEEMYSTPNGAPFNFAELPLTEENVKKWSVNDLAIWLKDQGLAEEIIAQLKKEQIDGQEFLQLTRELLGKSFPTGYWMKVSRLIESLKKQIQSAQATYHARSNDMYFGEDHSRESSQEPFPSSPVTSYDDMEMRDFRGLVPPQPLAPSARKLSSILPHKIPSSPPRRSSSPPNSRRRSPPPNFSANYGQVSSAPPPQRVASSASARNQEPIQVPSSSLGSLGPVPAYPAQELRVSWSALRKKIVDLDENLSVTVANLNKENRAEWLKLDLKSSVPSLRSYIPLLAHLRGLQLKDCGPWGQANEMKLLTSLTSLQVLEILDSTYFSENSAEQLKIALPRLKALRIKGSRPFLPLLKRLEALPLIYLQLDCTGNGSERDLVSGLANFQSLIAVHLFNFNINSVDALVNRPLLYLALVNCTSLSDVAIGRLLSSLPHLETLNLKDCYQLGNHTFSAFTNLRNLTDLNLSNCTPFNDQDLRSCFRNLTKLMYLDVSSCPHISDDTVMQLYSEDVLPNLIILTLDNCSLVPSTLDNIRVGRSGLAIRARGIE